MDNSLFGQQQESHQTDNNLSEIVYSNDQEIHGQAWLEGRADPKDKGSLLETMRKLDYND